ncbi:PREDICTED: UDP-glycosyltransferase 74E2 isoform X1 [Camelina sativa]|uniref:Glycosyltransferase n=2 Tax=Camelina sativa TaxID=90675 RepID=A0ABM0WRW0_CAMSA|nr:PREDICTED: UDP-glycosyltransferase 74E2 isoform X1 [Camelina sativa]
MREGSHVIVLPFPAQGHITPMSQFCKRLASKGLKITLIIVSDKPSPPYKTEHDSITVVPISNGFQEGEKRSQDLDDIMERVQTSIKTRLPKLIEDMNLSGNPPRALVYDSTMSWLLDVAHSYGLRGAVFFTQPWLVSTIYYHVTKGSFSVPSTKYGHSALASFPSFPMLNMNDLPSFLCESSSYPNLLRVVIDQLSNIDRVDIILCNTFGKLEEKLLKWVQSLWPVLNIGPTVPSMYLDKRLSSDKNYGFSLFDANVAECVEWLNSKQPSSVVYVSLGSLVVLKEDQMMELAEGLRQSGHFFLWVVRETEKNKLPRNYVEETGEKGLIVSWSPQLDVLTHESVGCFLTHCGWNSMLEGLSFGVPMIGMPHWADQPTNAKFMEDVWKVGVRVKADVNGFVRREEIVRRVGEVMEGEKGKEIRKNGEKWKVLAREAVSEGGSSDKSINEFVSKFC